MKQGKNPTRRQKEIIKNKHLNVANWLVISQTKEMLLLEHRHTGKTKEIYFQA